MNSDWKKLVRTTVSGCLCGEANYGLMALKEMSKRVKNSGILPILMERAL